MTEPSFDPGRRIRFGTRGSALALGQTELATGRLRAVHPDVRSEVHVVRTEGDRNRVSPLSEIGGRGVFTNAIERQIRSGRIDAAVHSAKDLPTDIDPAIPIVAFPDRDDPRDVLITRHEVRLEGLPANPVIGTSSRRREAQIRRLRPDARFVNLRGNIDTRLRRAKEPELDAIVVAAAGVLRLGMGNQISEFFAVPWVVPSPGQGAIAVQARAGSDAAMILAAIDDPNVSIPVTLERSFLAAVGAGCSMPVGAHVAESDDGFVLVAVLADADGLRLSFCEERLAAGAETAHIREIAAKMMVEITGSSATRSWSGWTDDSEDLAGARVLVTRPRLQSGQLIATLTERGAEALSLPAIRIEPVADSSLLDAALTDAVSGGFDWIVFTSANAVRAVSDRLLGLAVAVDRLAHVRIAAIGPATAAAAREAGFSIALTAKANDAGHLATELIARVGLNERVLYPRSTIGRDALPNALREAGRAIVVVDAYRTIPESDIDPGVLERIERREVDVIAFFSPSSITNLLAMLPTARRAVSAIPAVCAGPITAQAAREMGFFVAAVGADPGPRAMANAVAKYWRSRVSQREDSDWPLRLAGRVTKGSFV